MGGATSVEAKKTAAAIISPRKSDNLTAQVGLNVKATRKIECDGGNINISSNLLDHNNSKNQNINQSSTIIQAANSVTPQSAHPVGSQSGWKDFHRENYTATGTSHIERSKVAEVKWNTNNQLPNNDKLSAGDSPFSAGNQFAKARTRPQVPPPPSGAPPGNKGNQDVQKLVTKLPAHVSKNINVIQPPASNLPHGNVMTPTPIQSSPTRIAPFPSISNGATNRGLISTQQLQQQNHSSTASLQNMFIDDSEINHIVGHTHSNISAASVTSKAIHQTPITNLGKTFDIRDSEVFVDQNPSPIRKPRADSLGKLPATTSIITTPAINSISQQQRTGKSNSFNLRGKPKDDDSDDDDEEEEAGNSRNNEVYDWTEFNTADGLPNTGAPLTGSRSRLKSIEAQFSFRAPALQFTHSASASRKGSGSSLVDFSDNKSVGGGRSSIASKLNSSRRGSSSSNIEVSRQDKETPPKLTSNPSSFEELDNYFSFDPPVVKLSRRPVRVPMLELAFKSTSVDGASSSNSSHHIQNNHTPKMGGSSTVVPPLMETSIRRPPGLTLQPSAGSSSASSNPAATTNAVYLNRHPPAPRAAPSPQSVGPLRGNVPPSPMNAPKGTAAPGALRISPTYAGPNTNAASAAVNGAVNRRAMTATATGPAPSSAGVGVGRNIRPLSNAKQQQQQPTPPLQPSLQAPPQTPAASMSQSEVHSVKETSDVRRNRAQLPSTMIHAKPTTGDWLKKRYIVNNYILLDTLGTGSYGEVKLCKDRTTDKLFAMKIISKEMLKKKKNGNTSETYFEDIKREIAIMKKLLHPNVLRLFEVLDDPNVNKIYLVLEYMKKGDLIDFLKERDRAAAEAAGRAKPKDSSNLLPCVLEEELWYIFKQVLAGIRYLHFQNVVHGDIKPQNLLVGEDGVVKIADFGISKMLSGSGEKLADAAGTPAFMSPELCELSAGSEFSGQLADIWALGATMFMLRFGHPPFIAGNIMNLYFKIQNEPLHFPFAIDSSLQNLLENMLMKKPVERFTLQQTSHHPWLDRPPQPTRLEKGVSVSNTNSTTGGGATHSPPVNIKRGFQPPPSYEEEQAIAMKGPIHGVDEEDLTTSIGFGTQTRTLRKKKASEQTTKEDRDTRQEAKDGISESKLDEDEDEDMLQTKWGNDVFDKVDDSEFVSGSDDDDDDDDDYEDNKKNRAEVNLPKQKDAEKVDTNHPSKALPPIQNLSNSSGSGNSSDVSHTKSQASEVGRDREEMAGSEEEERARRFRDRLGKKAKDTHSGATTAATSGRNTSGVETESSRSTAAASCLDSNGNGSGSGHPHRRASTNSATDESYLSSSQASMKLTSHSERRPPPGLLVKTDSSATGWDSQVTDKKLLHHQHSHSHATSAEFTMREQEDSQSDGGSDNDLEEASDAEEGEGDGDGDGDGDMEEEDTNQLSMEDFASLMDTLACQHKLAASSSTQSIRGVGSINISRCAIPSVCCNPDNGLGGVYSSLQGPRLTQEDRCVYSPVTSSLVDADSLSPDVRAQMNQISLACVFDGHNGESCCEYLRLQLMAKLAAHPAFLNKNQIESAIRETFRELDNEVCSLLREKDDLSGSTATLAMYDGRRNVFTVGCVGDSVCVLSKGGKALELIPMHRLSNPEERTAVEKAGGKVMNNRVNGILAVSRAFGDIQFKSCGPAPGLVTAIPEIRSEVITPTCEFAIIASDGLWDVLSPQAAVNFVRKKLSVNSSQFQVAEDLAREALAQGSVDNVTVVLLVFNVTLSSGGEAASTSTSNISGSKAEQTGSPYR